MLSRVFVVFAAAFIALLVGGSAYAFECYNANRSEQGNQSAAKAPALQSLAEVLADPEVAGLCPEGVEHVLQGLEDAGFDPNILINWHTVMAQGLEKNGKGEDLLHNGKGIDHLSQEFFALVDPLIGEGFIICGG